MDPRPTSSSSRRRQQSPATPVSSPGHLIDTPPPSSSAARLPLHRRFPLLRRSPLLLSSSSHAHAWEHTPTDSSAARSLHHRRVLDLPARRPLSFRAVDDPPLNPPDTKPPLPPRASSAVDGAVLYSPDTNPPARDADVHSPESKSPDSPSNATTPPQEQVELAGMAMWFRSIVLFFAAAVVIYNEHESPVVMVSELAGVLCLYLHFWCSHITQFWMNRPYQEDVSPIILIWFVMVFMMAAVIGANYGAYVGMCITFLATMWMTGLLIGCIREYKCSTRCP